MLNVQLDEPSLYPQSYSSTSTNAELEKWKFSQLRSADNMSEILVTAPEYLVIYAIVSDRSKIDTCRLLCFIEVAGGVYFLSFGVSIRDNTASHLCEWMRTNLAVTRNLNHKTRVLSRLGAEDYNLSSTTLFIPIARAFIATTIEVALTPWQPFRFEFLSRERPNFQSRIIFNIGLDIEERPSILPKSPEIAQVLWPSRSRTLQSLIAANFARYRKLYKRPL